MTIAARLKVAIEALEDIAAGRPELDDWNDYNPQRIARHALRCIRRSSKPKARKR